MKAGPMMVLYPRPWGERAPMDWMAVQAVTHRRHLMHFGGIPHKGVRTFIDSAFRRYTVIADFPHTEFPGQILEFTIPGSLAGGTLTVMFGKHQLHDGSPGISGSS
jgi:hypothetical protein